MRLVALKDRGGWGADLTSEASRARGWDVQLVRRAEEVRGDGGYAFCRVAQHPVTQTAHDKQQARALFGRGFTTIPDLEQIELYDDKCAQTLSPALRPFMPRSAVARCIEEVEVAAELLGFPLLSKAAQGSASKEVRLLRTRDELLEHARQVLGPGVMTRYSVQKGYVILQEFLLGNEYDYRVVAVGRRRMALRRFNRSVAEPFASGSGKCQPVKEITPEVEAVLVRADEYFAAANTGWCGIDLVHGAGPRTHPASWKILESTLAWTQSAYADCVFFGSRYRGADIWQLLLDEIQDGVFD